MISLMNEEMRRLFEWILIGIAGGAVNVCNNPRKATVRYLVSSVMVSAASSAITGAMLHHLVIDQLQLCAICGAVAVMGRDGMEIATAIIRKKIFIYVQKNGDKGID